MNSNFNHQTARLRLDQRNRVEKPFSISLQGSVGRSSTWTTKQHPGATHRENFTKLVMLAVLHEQLKVINPWLEAVQQIQGGDERAECGKQVIKQLSAELNNKYGRGFSTTNLRYFRTFYTAYSDRIPEIRHIGGGESKATGNRHAQ
jgi:hypothetical protein